MNRFVLRRVLALGTLSALVVPNAAHAQFSMGTASTYGVLYTGTGNFQLTSDSSVTGSVGVVSSNGTTSGSNGNFVQFSGGTITGNLDLVGRGPTPTARAAPSTGRSTRTFRPSPGLQHDHHSLDRLGRLVGHDARHHRQRGAALSGGTGGTQANTGLPGTTGTTYVYNTTAMNFLAGGALTINGSASDYVVINVTGQNNVQLKNGLVLTGGITDDQVFINVTGTNQQIGGNTNGGKDGIINGVIVGLNDTINIDSVNINGRVFGGGGGDFQLVSNAFTRPAHQPPVPEPASVAMILIGGGMAAGYTAFRRRRASKAVTTA